MVCAANFLHYQVNERPSILYPTLCQLSKHYFSPLGGKSKSHACVSSDNQFVCPHLDHSRDSKTGSGSGKRFVKAKKRSQYSTGYFTTTSTTTTTTTTTTSTTTTTTTTTTSSEAFCDKTKCPLHGNFCKRAVLSKMERVVTSLKGRIDATPSVTSTANLSSRMYAMF